MDQVGMQGDISGPLISNMNNLKSTPSLSTLAKIAGALEVSVSELVKGI